MLIDLHKFYSIILKARMNKGYTQTNMSYFLGISQKNYFYLESGRCKMDLIKFLKVADALEMNPMEIINSMTSEAKWPDSSNKANHETERQKLLEEIRTLSSRNHELQQTITKLSNRENLQPEDQEQ